VTELRPSPQAARYEPPLTGIAAPGTNRVVHIQRASHILLGDMMLEASPVRNAPNARLAPPGGHHCTAYSQRVALQSTVNRPKATLRKLSTVTEALSVQTTLVMDTKAAVVSLTCAFNMNSYIVCTSRVT
jgi:hypothetical protein